MDPSSGALTPASDARPVRWGLGDFVWIYFAGLLVSIVGVTIGVAITGDKAGHLGALTTALGALGQFATWFAGVVYLSYWKGRRSIRKDFGFVFDISGWWGLPAGLGLFALGVTLIYPIVNMVNDNQAVVDDLNEATGAKLVVLLVLAGVIAPICEELLFRGLLLRALRRRMMPVAAIAVQALVFALIHPILSPTLGDLAVVPALLLLGVASGIAASERGDLAASILMHIGFNMITTLAAIH